MAVTAHLVGSQRSAFAGKGTLHGQPNVNHANLRHFLKCQGLIFAVLLRAKCLFATRDRFCDVSFLDRLSIDMH